MVVAQTGAASQPGSTGSRWPQAVIGLYVLAACVVGGVATSLVHGGYNAMLMSQPEHAPDLGGLSTFLLWSVRLLGYGLGVGQLVAVALVFRSGAPIRSLAGVALAMSGADLALGLLSELGWAFAGSGSGAFAVLKALGWLGLAVAVVAEALVFETVLRLRREASGGSPGQDGVLRGVFWAGWGPRLVLWTLGMVGMHRLLPPWPMFGVRLVLTLVIAGAILAAARAAILAVEAAPATAGGGPLQLAVSGAGASPAGSEAGLRNLALGVLWMLIGGGVTAFTYASASSSGGRYVVAYGAIAAGVVQAIVGLVQLTRGR